MAGLSMDNGVAIGKGRFTSSGRIMADNTSFKGSDRAGSARTFWADRPGSERGATDLRIAQSHITLLIPSKGMMTTNPKYKITAEVET
ncbi:hypothetical protein RR48_13606 [Papilio machaon]|uniref:Uncharacterized protein n=1 Tax=Papilio machaon TaxID=76193 RepID=A0A194RB88_PAPMA|nr:hypothetical protein RR48_13606 [Papilio machaon]